MFRWFSNSLAHQGGKAIKDERGFTLIELLVVVIIIGIIAAIAIPTFLSQRGSAQDAAAQSDLRNAATAQEAYYAENGSYYDGGAPASELPGFNSTEGINLSIPSANDSSFCMQASHDSSGTNFYFDSAEGTVSEGGCT